MRAPERTVPLLHEPPSPPSFIPEGYTPLTDATASIEGGWFKLRQHLYAGRIRGFIWTEQGRLVQVPAEDWGSPENNEAGQTGRAIKLNRAIVGGTDLQGFAVVKTSDLAEVKSTARQAPLIAKRSRGRRARSREAAAHALNALYPGGVSGKPWKTITAEVNNWLIHKQNISVSEDTVRRASKLK